MVQHHHRAVLRTAHLVELVVIVLAQCQEVLAGLEYLRAGILVLLNSWPLHGTAHQLPNEGAPALPRDWKHDS